MKTLLFFLFLYCATGFSQEEKEVTVFNTALKKGEMFFFGDNSVQFQQVISDSRCPKEVTCVWAGEAKVLVHIYEKGKFKNECILTVGGGNFPFDLLGNQIYSLSKLVLTPYPSVKNEDFGDEYVLNLSITEKK